MVVTDEWILTKEAAPVTLSSGAPQFSGCLQDVMKELGDLTQTCDEDVGAAHILLAFLRLGRGGAYQFLRNNCRTIAEVRRELDDIIRAAPSTQATRPASTQMDDVEACCYAMQEEAGHAFEFAVREAGDRGQAMIGTGHVLMALLHDSESPAGRLLAKHGMTSQMADNQSHTLLVD